MDESPALSKAASNGGETGSLVCRVSSAPPANFTWSREGSVITPDNIHKYLIDYKIVSVNKVFFYIQMCQEHLIILFIIFLD
jgi:hypothetical protein